MSCWLLAVMLSTESYAQRVHEAQGEMVKQREHNEKSSLWARIVIIVSREEANTIYT